MAQLIEELNLATLKKKDIRKEFAQLEKLIATVNSAQVSFGVTIRVNHALLMILYFLI